MEDILGEFDQLRREGEPQAPDITGRVSTLSIDPANQVESLSPCHSVFFFCLSSPPMHTPETSPVPVPLEGLLIIPVQMEERIPIVHYGLSCSQHLGHVLPGCGLTGMESSITSFTDNSMLLMSLSPSTSKYPVVFRSFQAICWQLRSWLFC